jgi:hypothetical protein
MSTSRDDEIESSEDEALYEKLDRFSSPMRDAAQAFSALLASQPDQTKDIQGIIQAVDRVAETHIKSLDIALNNFKKCMASLALKNNDENMFGKEVPPAELPILIKAYSDLIREIAVLSQIAIELSESLGD